MNALDLIASLERKLKSIQLQSAVSAFQEGLNIMERSESEFVPVDRGKLKDDGTVTVKKDGDDTIVTLSYGNSEEIRDYAVAVHETPSSHDPKSWKATTPNFKHGGPKYLERPVFEAEHGIAERIASRIKV